MGNEERGLEITFEERGLKSAPFEEKSASRSSDTRRTTHRTTMPSYTYETTMTTSSSSSSARSKSESRCSSVSSELDEEFYSGLNLTDQERLRLAREFYYPPHIAFSGNYYPRYKTKGDSHTGTSHVSYLSRPYYSYLVPSRYSGYSKYVYITKIN